MKSFALRTDYSQFVVLNKWLLKAKSENPPVLLQLLKVLRRLTIPIKAFEVSSIGKTITAVIKEVDDGNFWAGWGRVISLHGILTLLVPRKSEKVCQAFEKTMESVG